ncbi:MAG: pyridoxal phosphate-dependent aminotransferase [Clostridia bacterium]|nr:pyridoxal phosphate-dependent aminotransferase [Clostridia bacterium]
MKYDFDTPVDRRNTNSLKWDVAENELPMWVADMDFKTAPAVSDAIKKRAEHGVFGYTIIPDEWYEAYISHWQTRHNFTIQKDWLIFSTGVIPTISSVVRKLTTPAEKVVLQTPVYNIFFNSVLNNGRVVLQNFLKYDKSGVSIDFEDLEEKLSDPQTSLMILCNPHNPVGRIWSRDELFRIGELCRKYNVVVLSDEIHCDITDPGKDYVPFASVSDDCRGNCVVCVAPTKAFNIAGLQTSAVFIPNPTLRHKVWRALNTDEVAEPNAFAVDAAIAAFTKGGDWLDEFREYIYQNKLFAADFIARELPETTLIPSEATYLLWLKINSDASTAAKNIRAKTGLYLSSGSPFGGDGDSFLRINIACPRKTLIDGLNRLKNAREFL